MRLPQALLTPSTRRAFVCASLGTGLMAGIGANTMGTNTVGNLQPIAQWRERVLHGFGTTLWLRAAHTDIRVLNQGLDEAVQGLRAIEAEMSLFDQESDICQLNRTGFLANPGTHLAAALTLGIAVARASDGRFDPTVQSLWPVWAKAKTLNTVPTLKDLHTARSPVGWQGIHMENGGIRLDRPGMQITLNGIAQGYAADFARRVLKKHGVENALLNTGEWTMLGRSDLGRDWSIGLADPHGLKSILTEITSNGDSIATSSDNTTAFTADRRFHHILNPKTGMSPPHLSMVTVIAPSCALADALTKVFFMQAFDGAQALVRQWGVKAILVDKSGAMKVFA
jgi:FAD:protein FMN transferase